MSDTSLEARLNAFVGVQTGPYFGWDPVNAPMIRHWCEVMGDAHPAYRDRDFETPPQMGKTPPENALLAPPAMLQAWTMKGYGDRAAPGSDERNPFEVASVLDEAGFTGVVAVNCEQRYHRYLIEGENIYFTTVIEDVSDRKTTPLGVGFFVTALYKFYSTGPDRKTASQADECVGEMMFRILKFIPAQTPQRAASETKPDTPQKARRPRPGINRDNHFFWDGLKNHQLLVQKCTDCGTLRHPPGPMCPTCGSLKWEAAAMSGRGQVHSFVNMHHPQVPPFDSPNPIALVELDEGLRLVGGLIGVRPRDVKIGMRVKASYVEDDGLTLALFEPIMETTEEDA